ncbi:hypothetical protein AB9M62_30890 [Bacillales bacterium AN1005]
MKQTIHYEAFYEQIGPSTVGISVPCRLYPKASYGICILKLYAISVPLTSYSTLAQVAEKHCSLMPRLHHYL